MATSSDDSRNQSRRSFLKVGAAVGSALGFSTFGLKAKAQSSWITDPYYPEPSPKINNGSTFRRWSSKFSRPTGKIPILQGATSSTQTQFRVLVSKNLVHRYFISEGGVRKEILPHAKGGSPTSNWTTDHLFLEGLKPGGDYVLEIEDETGKIIDTRQFGTFPESVVHPEGAGAPLRVALISCQNDRYVNEQAGMWAAVAKSRPELMIFNGDSCYVDQRSDESLEGMWERHVTSRRMFDVFRWDRLVPTLVAWDDHDTGENNADSSNPRLPLAQDYFWSMFGSEEVDGYKRATGTATGGASNLNSVYDIAGMRFILLDDRSNKTSTQVFSRADEAWIESQISSSPGPIWLVNGIQFFGGYLLGSESVEDSSMTQLLRILRMGKRAQSPMVLVSGDVHFSEIMEIEEDFTGYPTFELTSSAIHSRTVPGIQFRSYNGRRIESTSRNNFMAVEMQARSKSQVDFEVVCLGDSNQEFFRRKLSVKR